MRRRRREAGRKIRPMRAKASSMRKNYGLQLINSIKSTTRTAVELLTKIR
jgi:hypothetical protein